ncbi:hypothetical protein BH23GEM4_BH23GEM4_20770 [soil metagenome]
MIPQGVIRRDPHAFAADEYDLVVVGGGVYGITLALEAARRGMRPLLLERGDFGGATSWNHLRIVHGGLRYLQLLDLRRFRESVAERRWFLRHFPELVRPLPCLMPLYGDGLRTPAVMRAALAMNDLLSARRNVGVRDDAHLPRGRVLNPAETAAMFPLVERSGLRGGALWYDAVMTDPQRLLMELLRWACVSGARALNYVEAVGLLEEDGRVTGVEGHDHVGAETLRFRAPVVVNCAGPWSRSLARDFDRDLPRLFRSSLAFNVWLRRAPSWEVAVAVTPRQPGARTYFMHPWHGGVLAGTYHGPWEGDADAVAPTAAPIEELLSDLNAAVPGWGLRRDDVGEVYAGLLPVDRDGTIEITKHPEIHDHGTAGGPAGLYSVSGVKFTTARDVAERLLRRIAGGDELPDATGARPEPRPRLAWTAWEALRERGAAAAAAYLRGIVAEEAVVRREDLLLRRTDWTAGGRDATLDDEEVEGAASPYG